MDRTYGQMVDRISNELQRNDSDIASIIRDAISDAIKHFKDEVFAVNQASYYVTASKFETTSSAFKDQSTNVIKDPLHGALVSLPDDFSEMLNLQVVKSATTYDMKQIPYVDLDRMDAKYDSPSTGTPQYYAYFGEYMGPRSTDSSPAGSANNTFTFEMTPGFIRIYPRPDAAYTLSLRYVSNLADPMIDAKSIPPTTDEIADAHGKKGFWMNEAARMIKCYAKAVIYADYLQQFELAQAQESLAESEYNRLVMRSESRGFSDSVTPHL